MNAEFRISKYSRSFLLSRSIRCEKITVNKCDSHPLLWIILRKSHPEKHINSWTFVRRFNKDKVDRSVVKRIIAYRR